MYLQERIEAVAIGHSGYARQGLIDDITALVAAAWDEGYREAIEIYGCDIPWGGTSSDDNPYRTET